MPTTRDLEGVELKRVGVYALPRNNSGLRGVGPCMSLLLSPVTLRGTTMRNRAWVAPMCQYSSVDGRVGDWHLAHLGGLARGGAGLVISEATAVTPEGRISPHDAGLWDDDQAGDWARITAFVAGQGAVPGVQLGARRAQGVHPAAVGRQRPRRDRRTAAGRRWRRARSRTASGPRPRS